MKHGIQFSLLLTLFALLNSCGHKHTATEIVLDNGKQWTANPETTSGINNMIKIMDGFTSTEENQDYKNLTSSLTDEFQLIFKNCTMQGEAHNQLHNFLLPMKEMFEGLKSKDSSVQKETFETLKAHLKSYPNYFQ